MSHMAESPHIRNSSEIHDTYSLLSPRRVKARCAFLLCSRRVSLTLPSKPYVTLSRHTAFHWTFIPCCLTDKTPLSFQDIAHTSTELPSFTGVSLSPTVALRPVHGFPVLQDGVVVGTPCSMAVSSLSRRLLWRLRLLTTTSTAASPSPKRGRWSDLPRSRICTLRLGLGSLCTPVRYLLIPSHQPRGLYPYSRCRFGTLPSPFSPGRVKILAT